MIQNVADTAFWVATYRADESRRPDALFRDPLAERLVEGRGREIAQSMTGGKQVAWVVVIRTCIIDELLEHAIAGGCDTVLNLGAGLDTRPYRMKLPPSLRWIEVDFPATIDFKNEKLAGEKPHCQLERKRVDLGDATARRALFAEVKGDKIVVLTEGVIMYLSTEQVSALAKDLHAQPRISEWLLEYNSPTFMKMVRLMSFRRRSQLVNAPFKFDPGSDWHAFFRAGGWKAGEMRYLAEEGIRLGRPAPASRWLRLVMRILFRQRRQAMMRGAGYALLERV